MFHKPVLVQRGRIDRDRIILSARDAADFLLRDWPAGTEAKRERAMLACLDVLRGQKPPSHARRAFIMAAKEARILLDDWSGRNWRGRVGKSILPDQPLVGPVAESPASLS